MYPDIDHNSTAYTTELARHMDDAFRMGTFECLWNGTNQLQRIIQRDGLEAKQKLLGQLRASIAELEDTIAGAAKLGQYYDDQVLAAMKRMREVSEPTYLRNPVSHMKEQQAPDGRKVAEQIALANSAKAAKERMLAGVSLGRTRLATYRQAEERLTAGLIMYYQAEAQRSQAPVEAAKAEPPVINITAQVAAPEVHLECTLPEPNIILNLPTRKTESTIQRDQNGNIIATTQIESTLEE